MSLWAQGSGSVSITGNLGAGTISTGATYGGWTYYEYKFAAGTTSLTLSSTAGAYIDDLKLFPQDAQMSNVGYNLDKTIAWQTAPGGQVTFYQYDGFSRLVNILDMAGNIVKNYKYNFGLGSALTAPIQTLWYNNPQQGSFTRTGCISPAEPTTEIYRVPYGKYVSAISQTDADGKAVADVNANGLAYANSVGQCLYWNDEQYNYFTYNGCTVSQGSAVCTGGNRPFNTKYTVPAHTYSSPIDKTTANNLAIADLNTNGPIWAQTHCSCSCGGEGQKVVNGVCETGTRWNSSTTQLANGQWQCVYYYQFSDGSVSQNYTSVGSSPCPIQ